MREWVVVVSDRYFTVKAGGTYLRNAVALDPALSVDAVGLLMVMLAMHPRAPKNRDSLVGRGMGRDRVAKALRCLEAAGLRYRFRASGRKPGTWETLTLLFDEPVSVEQAWASIDPAMAAAVVACVSHPQDSADCVRGTETCTPVDSGGASGVQVSDGRKPVRPPKGANNSSLRSELPPDHPGERADETSADCLPSRVERGVDSGPTKSQTRNARGPGHGHHRRCRRLIGS